MVRFLLFVDRVVGQTSTNYPKHNKALPESSPTRLFDSAYIKIGRSKEFNQEWPTCFVK
jgi:hypothetical protein